MNSTQRWDPDQYGRNARFVADLGLPVVELLAPQPGERILDLGCGDGALTIKLAALGCSVVGVDASAEMVAAARSLGLEAHVMDGAELQFMEEFEAVFSNAALHWMRNPESVVSGVWRALKSGGRFVGELGGQGNIAAILAAIDAALADRGIVVPCPWFFPRPDEYRQLLEASGFEVRAIDLFPRPTVLPGDMAAWMETFAQPYTTALPAAERGRFISEVVAALRGRLCNADGGWIADYVRLRFSAAKSPILISPAAHA